MSKPQYEQPIVSIDVVPVRYQGVTGLQVLRGQRRFEPFIGQAALPGVMLGHETLEAGAYRALESKVGVRREDVALLMKLSAFDTTDRDPRGPTISITFVAVLTPEFEAPAGTDWVDLDPAQRRGAHASPFDHDSIMDDAWFELGLRLWREAGLTRALLGAEFSTAKARTLTESLTAGNHFDLGNFTRQLKSLAYLEEAGKTSGGRGRPSIVWRVRD